MVKQSNQYHHVLELRVEKPTVLGVVVNSSLTATDHVSYLLDSCSSLRYALCVLRRPVTDHRSVGERRFSCYSDRHDDTLIAASVCLLISLHTSKLLSVPRC